ncbi:hypothetical protein NE686_17650 [Tissierella carlieri]|uniref:Uncharacterized protein n=1 Tax=Tissierella carlieri TaxID=689904 RepID=A0ABT1SEQ3_9FIRM|nr:hypothetical protein [Tissierella carlieri]MCQ4924931.1 hypothetical protein [Tissierella carlieri]
MKKIEEEGIFIGLKSDKPVSFNPFINNLGENFNAIVLGEPGCSCSGFIEPPNK